MSIPMSYYTCQCQSSHVLLHMSMSILISYYTCQCQSPCPTTHINVNPHVLLHMSMSIVTCPLNMSIFWYPPLCICQYKSPGLLGASIIINPQVFSVHLSMSIPRSLLCICQCQSPGCICTSVNVNPQVFSVHLSMLIPRTFLCICKCQSPGCLCASVNANPKVVSVHLSMPIPRLYLCICQCLLLDKVMHLSLLILIILGKPSHNSLLHLQVFPWYFACHSIMFYIPSHHAYLISHFLSQFDLTILPQN